MTLRIIPDRRNRPLFPYKAGVGGSSRSMPTRMKPKLTQQKVHLDPYFMPGEQTTHNGTYGQLNVLPATG